jgi:hypothetical protein
MNRTRRYVFKPKQRKGKIGYRPRVLKIRPGADAGLKKVFASIGVPDKKPFKPDVFQLEALSAIRDTDCLVTVQSEIQTALSPSRPAPARPGSHNRPWPGFLEWEGDLGMLPL